MLTLAAFGVGSKGVLDLSAPLREGADPLRSSSMGPTGGGLYQAEYFVPSKSLWNDRWRGA